MTSTINKVKSLKAAILLLKDEFKQEIVNKDVPLETRWAMFVEAPSELKEHSSYCTSLDNLPEDTIMYDGVINCERHETITTLQVVESIEELLDNMSDTFWVTDKIREDFADFSMDNLKEEILSKNLGSFTYDW